MQRITSARIRISLARVRVTGPLDLEEMLENFVVTGSGRWFRAWLGGLQLSALYVSANSSPIALFSPILSNSSPFSLGLIANK